MIAAATIHAPYITAWPKRADQSHRDVTAAGFAKLGRAFLEAEVDTVVVFTSEHILNLQPRMAAPFIVGIGETNRTFHEPHFNLPGDARRGNAAVGRDLLEGLYRHGFDPVHSSDLLLDHGTIMPLAQMGFPDDLAIVPIVINSIFPPFPSLERCRAFGRCIGEHLRASTSRHRVGLLATGGLSHRVGTPGVEQIDADFDARFVDALLEGDLDRAAGLSDEELDAAGNGTHEIRNWVALAAAVHPLRPKVVTRIAYAQGWDTGVHQLLWEAI